MKRSKPRKDPGWRASVSWSRQNELQTHVQMPCKKLLHTSQCFSKSPEAGAVRNHCSRAYAALTVARRSKVSADSFLLPIRKKKPLPWGLRDPFCFSSENKVKHQQRGRWFPAQPSPSAPIPLIQWSQWDQPPHLFFTGNSCVGGRVPGAGASVLE